MANENDSTKNKSNSRELGIGTIFLLLIVGVFILWVLTGGPREKTNKKTLFKESTFPETNEIQSFGTTKTKYGLTTPTPKKQNN